MENKRYVNNPAYFTDEENEAQGNDLLRISISWIKWESNSLESKLGTRVRLSLEDIYDVDYTYLFWPEPLDFQESSYFQ